jgi:hypothetical protein
MEQVQPDPEANPFDQWLSFPPDQVIERQDREFSGRVWTSDFELELPRPIVQTSLRAQFELAGFVLESEASNRGLVRFFRPDAYIWGVLSDRKGGGSLLSLALTILPREGEALEEPAP